jgi:hypothetical protein
MKNPEPINIAIDIISKNGKKIKSFSESEHNAKAYQVIPENGWNGTNNNNVHINNGTYFYNLNIKDQDGKVLYNKIHNITILK